MTTYTTCICGSDLEDGFMICCDECDTWMHGPCVSITKSFATGIDLYYCPRCRPQPQLPSTHPSSQPRAKKKNNQMPLKRRGSRKADDTESEEQPKRPRGRSRKVNDTGTNTTTATATSSMPTTTTTSTDDPSRHRGRPRKAKVLDYDAITSPWSSLSPSSWLVSLPSSSTTTTTTTTTTSMAHRCNSRLTEMSEEILLQILAFVHCHKSIIRVGATCRRLWRIAHDPYLWKYVTLSHDTPLRRHWLHHLKPFLLLNNLCSLTLLGEIPAPVHIHALALDAFTSLQTLRLTDVQTYSVYVLVRSLPWLRVFEARRIKGASEIWDWRPFQHLNQLEELMLWRNEESSVKTFSLSDGVSSSSTGLSRGGGRQLHGADEIYPYELIQAATEALGTGPGSIATFMGMTNETFDLFVSDVEEHEDEDGEDEDEDDDEESDEETGSGALIDMADQNSDTSGSNHFQGSLSSSSTITTASSSSSSPTTQEREIFLPRLRKLALINIGSPTTHRGTDAVLRKLVARVHSFIYGHHSFNILFPVLRTTYAQLRHLCLLEPSGPAWKHGTWQHHVRVFSGMVRLETLTLVNPNMSRKFMQPILDAVLALERLQLVHVVALEQDIENVDAVFKHVVTSKWSYGHGRTLKISLKDDHRHDILRTSRGWHRRGGHFDEAMEDGVSGSGSSSSHAGKDKGSLSSLEEIRSNEEWCEWAREQVKAVGHGVVGLSCPREGKGKGKDGSLSSSSSLSGGRSTLSVEIEMVSSWQAYDSGLSQVCMEAWQAH